MDGNRLEQRDLATYGGKIECFGRLVVRRSVRVMIVDVRVMQRSLIPYGVYTLVMASARDWHLRTASSAVVKSLRGSLSLSVSLRV